MIKSIMTSDLVVVHPNDSIDKVKHLFATYDIHHILVTVLDDLRGIITKGDILFFEGHISTQIYEILTTSDQYNLLNAQEIMTPDPICIVADAPIENALTIMMKNRINALPVVEGDKVVGIVTSFDMMACLQKKLNSEENLG